MLVEIHNHRVHLSRLLCSSFDPANAPRVKLIDIEQTRFLLEVVVNTRSNEVFDRLVVCAPHEERQCRGGVDFARLAHSAGVALAYRQPERGSCVGEAGSSRGARSVLDVGLALVIFRLEDGRHPAPFRLLDGAPEVSVVGE